MRTDEAELLENIHSFYGLALSRMLQADVGLSSPARENYLSVLLTALRSYGRVEQVQYVCLNGLAPV